MPEVQSQKLRMHIATPVRDLAMPHCIKVNLSNEMRIKLHSHKLLSGSTISSTVEEALQQYFHDRYAPGRVELTQAILDE